MEFTVESVSLSSLSVNSHDVKTVHVSLPHKKNVIYYQRGSDSNVLRWGTFHTLVLTYESNRCLIHSSFF